MQHITNPLPACTVYQEALQIKPLNRKMVKDYEEGIHLEETSMTDKHENIFAPASNLRNSNENVKARLFLVL